MLVLLELSSFFSYSAIKFLRAASLSSSCVPSSTPGPFTSYLSGRSSEIQQKPVRRTEAGNWDQQEEPTSNEGNLL
jgi:hypothetical protein